MHCLKTGFTLFIEEQNCYTRVDLFTDGINLFSNTNTLYPAKKTKDSLDIEISCTGIEDQGKFWRLDNPTVNQSVVDYVKEFHYKSVFDELFIKKYTNT